MSKELKLEMELVPSPCWYCNLNRLAPKAEWDKIRKQAYADAGHKCAICCAEGRLNCHEVWQYDDRKRVQTLKGFTALCDKCHLIKHIGFAGTQSWVNMDDLKAHFMNVNGVDAETYDRHEEHTWDVWRKRSKYKQWKTDLGQWAGLVKEGDKNSKTTRNTK